MWRRRLPLICSVSCHQSSSLGQGEHLLHGVQHCVWCYNEIEKENPDSDFGVWILCLYDVMMLVEDMQIAFYRNAAELVFIVFIEVDECAYVVHGSACANLQFYTVEQMAYHDG